MSNKWSRRGFLGISVAILGFPVSWKSLRKYFHKPTGVIRGASHQRGHQIREKGFPKPENSQKKSVVIVGGGVAGLSAAWYLKKNGFNNFVLLELENETGGNSINGSNSIGKYPWGAHYLPLPNPTSKNILALLSDLGVIQSFDKNGLPNIDETFLSQDPQERLKIGTRWQEGLVPQIGITTEDSRQINQFLEKMTFYREAKGFDGKYLFEIPVDESSTDIVTRSLDQISMLDYLNQQGWTSPALHWYVDYCCKDDYGAQLSEVSAWAGIHYFASRRGNAANSDRSAVLTWPEGNSWLAQQLRKKIEDQIHTQALVFKIRNSQNSSEVDYFDFKTQSSHRIEADHVIYCAPRFTAPHIIDCDENAKHLLQSPFEYSPWVVANLSVNLPYFGVTSDFGEPQLSWDNVFYQSRSLGYVNSKNQAIERFNQKTVLTYYWPLSHTSPKIAREEAKNKTSEQWITDIKEDFLRHEPERWAQIQNVDIWVWGHGMVRPSPNKIWSEERSRMKLSIGQIHFAHSDMGGISIFEEAHSHGIHAAKKVLISLDKGQPHA